ncbi:unnamed protein product, partial [Phaeothamnion confervicola]
MLWADRREHYRGFWRDDMQEGWGEHVWLADRPPSHVLDTHQQMCNVYRGEWHRGLRHGRGEFHYANGARYAGEWRDNCKHGRALFFHEDGRVVEADFAEDKMTASPKAAGEKRDLATLNASVKLRIGDIIQGSSSSSSGGGVGSSTAAAAAAATAAATAAMHEVNRVVLQVNSELRRCYKRYSLGANAAKDETVFTMTVAGFLSFAHDCGALAPRTALSEAEVYRMLRRMRRHHALQLAAEFPNSAAALLRHGGASSGGGGNGGGGSRRRSSGGGRSNTGGGAYDVAATEAAAAAGLDFFVDVGALFDPERPLFFRDFVEAVVRLAHASS